MTTAIKSIISEHAKHLESVRPGLPAAFSPSATAGDCIVQGDLYLTIVDAVPAGYTKVGNPTDKHRQLVPEAGAGSHHRLDSLMGVALYYPPGFDLDRDGDSLDGPCFVTTREVVVRHEPGHDKPHGPVTVPAGMTVLCTYQREWAKEEARERRARD